MQTEIWAHRGANLEYPENTMAAFERAIALGADGIEIDVQRTLDGKIVICHDENLLRLTGENVMLKDKTYEELLELNFSQQDYTDTRYKLPLLEELLDLLQDTQLKLNIELKNSILLYKGMEEQIINLVSERTMQEQVFYSTFNHESANKLVELGYADHTAILYSSYLHDDIAYAKTVGVKILHPLLTALQKPNFVASAHDAGFKVNVWTVNQPEHLAIALYFGVDAIITDEIGTALEMRTRFVENPQEFQNLILQAMKSLQ